MAYVALYRQWRPQDFDSLVGQEHISTTLKNALVQDRIAHAYLFAGPRGTGKTSTAKILAKALNCEAGPTPSPCNKCAECERITAGNSMDVFEIDAASNRGIDEIRELRETVKFAPVSGRYKVYIIDEVHMLTPEAFNALLKTLEEPPDHVVFILATTEAHKIPATIHSRCQRYDFHRITVGEIERRLTEIAAAGGLDISPEALRLIAVQAEGGMRDALSILDQCTAFGGNTVTAPLVRQMIGLIGHEWIIRLVELIAGRDGQGVLFCLEEIVGLGKDVRQVLIELAAYIRCLMLFKAAPDFDLAGVYAGDRESLATQSAEFSHPELAKMIDVLYGAAAEARWAPEPRISAEVALLSLCRRDNPDDIAALRERVTALENRLADLTALPAAAPSAPVRTAASKPVPAQNVVRESPRPAITPPVPAAKLAAARPAAGPVKRAEPAGPPDEAGQKIWGNVLQELLANGKRSVHACVSQGELIRLDDKKAVVRFVSSFPRERTEKEDYRAIIEKILAQVCGRPVSLQCVAGDRPGRETAPAAAPVPPARAGKPEAAGELDPVLSNAKLLFDGDIIETDNNEGE